MNAVVPLVCVVCLWKACPGRAGQKISFAFARSLKATPQFTIATDGDAKGQAKLNDILAIEFHVRRCAVEKAVTG